MIRTSAICVAFGLILVPASVQAQHPIRPLANDFVTVFESPDPGRVFCYTPGLLRLESGRFIATLDISGPGMTEIPGPKADHCTEAGLHQGKIFTSDNGGRTWTHRADFAGFHARPFVAGKSIYVLGHTSDLTILKSDDQGVTWTEPVMLSEGQQWHQSACNVHYANGCVYLVMERRVAHDIKTWYVGELAPVLMRGRIDADLTRRENWTFATELPFKNALPGAEGIPAIDYFGVPFFAAPYPRGGDAGGGRNCAPLGWLEANVVQFTDPDHVWHDPTGKTFHVWMRANTGGTGYAAIAKVIEQSDGSLQTTLEQVPSGKKVLYVPCPGGQMRFHILYDESTKLFWLLGSQSIDSMTRADRLPKNRFSLPNNERHRLVLHFSKNCIDWCFAGLVAVGDSPNQGRHYASMVIDGADLCIVSRSGDSRAKNAHDGNIISFHRVSDFRKLVY